jgi:hypothetical protein
MYLSDLRTILIVCLVSSLIFSSIQSAFSLTIGVPPAKDLGLSALRATESSIDNSLNINRESALDIITGDDDNTDRKLESVRDALVTSDILTRSLESAADPGEEKFEDAVESDAATKLSRDEIQQQRNRAAELAVEAEQSAIALLDPPTRNCDANKYDLAVHIIKGKGDLGKVLNNLNGKDMELELISDLKPTDTSIVLLDAVDAFKGKMIIDPTDEADPKEFDFDIHQMKTQCLTNTAIDEIIRLKSNIDDPLVITNLGSGLINGPTSSGTNTVDETSDAADALVKGAGQIFQRCPGSDFATYSIIANGKDLKSNFGKNHVDITIKIVVDLDRNPNASTNAVAIIDDNKILAMTLIAEEGKHNEKILDFVPSRINTVCNDVSYLVAPIDIDKKEERIDPLYGFKEIS